MIHIEGWQRDVIITLNNPCRSNKSTPKLNPAMIPQALTFMVYEDLSDLQKACLVE